MLVGVYTHNSDLISDVVAYGKSRYYLGQISPYEN